MATPLVQPAKKRKVGLSRPGSLSRGHNMPVHSVPAVDVDAVMSGGGSTDVEQATSQSAAASMERTSSMARTDGSRPFVSPLRSPRQTGRLSDRADRRRSPL